MSVYDSSTTPDNTQSFIRKANINLGILTDGIRVVLRIFQELGVTPGEVTWLLALGIKCGFKYPGEQGVSFTDAELAMTQTCQRRSLRGGKEVIKRSRKVTQERQSVEEATVVVTISRPFGEGKGKGRPYVYDPLFLKVIEAVIDRLPPGAPGWLERRVIVEEVQKFAAKKRRQLEEARKRAESPSASIKRGVGAIVRGAMVEMSIYKEDSKGLDAAMNHLEFHLTEKVMDMDPEVAAMLLDKMIGRLTLVRDDLVADPTT